MSHLSLPSCSRAGARASLHSIFGLAPICLLAGACHLVVSPSGRGEDETDEAGVEARACGEHTCSAGNVCCNASCGICTAPGNVCIQIACEPASEDTTCSARSCLAGELCMETPAGTVCVPEAENPCHLVDCQPNSTCKVEQGAPVCVALNGSGDAGAPIKKDAGTTPAPSDGGASPSDAGQTPHDAGTNPPLDGGTQLDASVPEHDASTPPDAGSSKDTGTAATTCAAVLCPTGTYCDDISGVAECLQLPSCATVRCSAGYHCQLEQVQCIRAPCPPQPMCVADTDSCAAIKCKAGTHCEVTPIVCITAPCDPIAQCVADKPVCGCSGKGACLDIVCPALDPTY